MRPVGIFGEVLFDSFPDGVKVLGGAPFNVAWHLQAFRQQPDFISSVGVDAEGETIRNSMQRWGMDCSHLQSDDSHGTGLVEVSLDAGEPSYDIVDQVAYDFIDADQLGDLDLGILYHGSLALRHEPSRLALQKLKSSKPSIVFMDVNLRQPWWQKERLLAWVNEADWVKLNEEEFTILSGETADLQSSMLLFLQQYNLQGLVVTLGERGAIAVTENRAALHVASERVIDIVDTVGAGDAFSSVLLLGLNLGWPVRQTLERAQQFAAALVGQRGATIDDPAFYQPLIDSWGL
jgi:fructokinase